MKYIGFLLLFLFFVIEVRSQNILVLEKPGTARNFKYTEYDHISILQTSTDSIISGRLSAISDSSISINGGPDILLNDIQMVYRTSWGFNLFQKTTLLAGSLYLGISTINGMVNNDSPVVPKETLIIGGSLTAAGLILIPLTTRRLKPGKGVWRLVILDFTE
ncbi:MAG: hypothetical protein KDC05_07620 [Bacteroidales bacterium]|nr:hypothetical protein [Bacteroidales bacterium]